MSTFEWCNVSTHNFGTFMSLPAVPTFESFNPGKTKIYCNFSENSLSFVNGFMSNPRYSISRCVHYPPHYFVFYSSL